jgi:hypothetical protein
MIVTSVCNIIRPVQKEESSAEEESDDESEEDEVPAKPTPKA